MIIDWGFADGFIRIPHQIEGYDRTRVDSSEVETEDYMLKEFTWTNVESMVLYIPRIRYTAR